VAGPVDSISVAAEALQLDIRGYRCRASASPVAFEFEVLRVGRLVKTEEKNSIADTVMVPVVEKANFPILRVLVEGIILVDYGKIAAAILLLMERKRILAEGDGATPLATLLYSSNKIPKGRR
jgi:threonine dehydratase